MKTRLAGVLLASLLLAGCGTSANHAAAVSEHQLNACLERHGWRTTEDEPFNPASDEPASTEHPEQLGEAPRSAPVAQLKGGAGLRGIEMAEVEHTELSPPPRVTIAFYNTAEHAKTIGVATHAELGSSQEVRYDGNVAWLEWGTDNALIEETIAGCIP